MTILRKFLKKKQSKTGTKTSDIQDFPTYEGNAGKYLKINDDESAPEVVDIDTDIQDIVGAMGEDTDTINFSYDSTTHKITNEVIDDSITKEKINSDVAGTNLSQDTDGSLKLLDSINIVSKITANDVSTNALTVNGLITATNASLNSINIISNLTANRISCNSISTNALNIVSSLTANSISCNSVSTNSLIVTGLLSVTSGNTVFNESGDASTDFRVESDTEANMIFLDANGDTDGAFYIGGTTNGIKIKKGASANIELLGTAKAKLSMRPAFVAGAVAGAGKPTPVTFGVWAGYSMPISTGSDSEVLHWRLTIPGRWDGASDIIYTAVVCLADAETEGDDFKFQLDWNHTDGTTGAIDATAVQNLTASGECTAGHTAQYSVFKLTFTIDWDIDTPDIVAGDVLAGKLFRIASGGTEVSNEIIVLDHWLTFTVDKVFKIS